MASAVDLAPTLLVVRRVSTEHVADRFPISAVTRSLPALEGEAVRDGVLTAVESITTLDAAYWRHFGEPTCGAPAVRRAASRPAKRGFLRGYTDRRYIFGRYFSPLEPNRPRDLDGSTQTTTSCCTTGSTDPHETTNLAARPEHRDVVADYARRLESLIDDEVGTDTDAWVTTRPELLGNRT